MGSSLFLDVSTRTHAHAVHHVSFATHTRRPRDEGVIADTRFMELRNQGVRAVAADLSVFLHGETGTGKEILARDIHRLSMWKDGQFVAINCGALPESLIESELFGYRAGAFTGARREGARGLLEQANGGVLFLDEIGDMPMGLQTRLLRVLQEREVQPLGSERRIPLRFGVLSASHQDLGQGVRQGRFRSDLYYRLQGLQLSVPPLRERPGLASFLLEQARRLGLTIPAGVLELMCQYGWPGNYREMHSVLRRLPCQYPGITRIEAWMLPAEVNSVRLSRPASTHHADSRGHGFAEPIQRHLARHAPARDHLLLGTPSASVPDTRQGLRHTEHRAILRALADSNGNMTHAARRLGIHRSTLYRKLRSLKQG